MGGRWRRDGVGVRVNVAAASGDGAVSWQAQASTARPFGSRQKQTIRIDQTVSSTSDYPRPGPAPGRPALRLLRAEFLRTVP